MSLPPVCGHADLRRRLRETARDGRLPQSLLLHGPPGVGKERLALWLAAMVLCGRPDEAPCGRCRSCRLADALQHPDIHWFFPVPSPRGSLTPEKRREKLEEARLAALDELREHPMSGGGRSPDDALFLSVVDEIRARASRRPAMSERAVFVLGDAERMVPQA
jgi:DNA polymerase III subunit delta'